MFINLETLEADNGWASNIDSLDVLLEPLLDRLQSTPKHLSP